MELREGDLLLRPFRDEDAPAIAAACDDRDTARFIPGMPSPYSDDDARVYVELCKRWWAAGERCARAIVEAETGELLGSIDVRLGEEGSIGYWIAPGARGRGVATRALVLLSRWALAEGGVRRLELTTHPENGASQRVAEKAGFRRVGVREHDLAFGDGRRESVVFELP